MSEIFHNFTAKNINQFFRWHLYLLLNMYYYRGLHNWSETPGYLRDTCLTAQDNYAALLDYFRIKWK